MNTGSPWYKNFWPWFLVVLLGISVIASLSTVVVAYRMGDLEIPDAPVSPSNTDSGRGR